MNKAERQELKLKKLRSQRQSKLGLLRKAIKEQSRFYSRYEKPLKPRYPHLIASDDYKRHSHKTSNIIFYSKRNEITHLKRC